MEKQMSSNLVPVGEILGTLPVVDETCATTNKTPKERFLYVLDALENHVETLRKQASQVEEDREYLLSSLDAVQNSALIQQLKEDEKNDVMEYHERITSRCLTVEIRVQTQRNSVQEEFLHQVNSLIDALITNARQDSDGARTKCISYMNACSSHLVQGSTDKKFESVLLGCTVDDQKKVKKRLQGLLHYIDQLEGDKNAESCS